MNEELTNVSGEEMSDVDTDYVAAIQELQKTTVSREQYNKLKAENSKLLNALVRGETIEQPKVDKPSIRDLRKKLFQKDAQLSNLDYISTALDLRDQLIDNGERDPFLPYGDRVDTTADHYDTAEKVANVLRECVEFAEGDNGIFTAELQRRTKDTMPIRRR